MTLLDNLLNHREMCSCGKCPVYGESSFDAATTLVPRDGGEKLNAVVIVRPDAESRQAAFEAMCDRYGLREIYMVGEMECQGAPAFYAFLSRPDNWTP